jgi:hypothetical protein
MEKGFTYETVNSSHHAGCSTETKNNEKQNKNKTHSRLLSPYWPKGYSVIPSAETWGHVIDASQHARFIKTKMKIHPQPPPPKPARHVWRWGPPAGSSLHLPWFGWGRTIVRSAVTLGCPRWSALQGLRGGVSLGVIWVKNGYKEWHVIKVSLRLSLTEPIRSGV